MLLIPQWNGKGCGGGNHPRWGGQEKFGGEHNSPTTPPLVLPTLSGHQDNALDTCGDGVGCMGDFPIHLPCPPATCTPTYAGVPENSDTEPQSRLVPQGVTKRERSSFSAMRHPEGTLNE